MLQINLRLFLFLQQTIKMIQKVSLLLFLFIIVDIFNENYYIVAATTNDMATINMSNMNKFEFDDSLGYLVSKANAAMRGKFNKFIVELGLNSSSEQWGLLNVVKVNPGMTQKEIAAKIDKDKTNVTRMIDVLERDGRLKRESDPKDRRIFRIYLTEAGELLIKKLIPIADRVNKESSMELNSAEVVQLKILLKKIQNTFRKGD